jgi:hypothetical protein
MPHEIKILAHGSKLADSSAQNKVLTFQSWLRLPSMPCYTFA